MELWTRKNTPVPKSGRPLNVKVEEAAGFEEQFQVDSAVGQFSSSEADESEAGGRVSRKSKKKGFVQSIRMLTQDEVEEDCCDFAFRGPEPDFDLDFDLDD